MNTTIQNRAIFLSIIIIILFASDPLHAQASETLPDSETNFLKASMDILMDPLARLMCIVTIVITGALALARRLSWDHAFFIIICLIVVFTIPIFVDVLNR